MARVSPPTILSRPPFSQSHTAPALPLPIPIYPSSSKPSDTAPRPKLNPAKKSCSTLSSQRTVQSHLEHTSQRLGGWQPFWVPLARGVPPPPPSSPVSSHMGDYFPAGWREARVGPKSEDEWVEDVSAANGGGSGEGSSPSGSNADMEVDRR